MPKYNPVNNNPFAGASNADPFTGLRAVNAPTTMPVKSELQKGLISGGKQLSSATAGLEGAARALVGDDAGAAAATQESIRLQEEAGRLGPRVTDIDHIKDIGDFADWVAGTIGQQAPIMGSMLLGGPAALAGRGVAQVAARTLLPKAAPLIPSATTAATGGMIGAATGIETGSIFPDINSDPQSRINMSPRERALTALTGGAIAGGLEALPFIGIANRFGVGKAATRAVETSLAKEIAKGTLTQGAIEAGTEAAQTVVERATLKFANDNRDIFTEEGINEIKNAAAGGLLLGGLIGAGGGTYSSLAGATDEFIEKYKDYEAFDQLEGAHLRASLEKLRGKYAGNQQVSDEIESVLSQDLQDPEVRDAGIKFSLALTEISAAEDVLKERGLLSDTGEQMNDILTLSEYARDPELIDNNVMRELNNRYGAATDIIDDIRERLAPTEEAEQQAGVEGDAAFVPGEEGEAGTAPVLGTDISRPASFVADVDARKPKEKTVSTTANVLSSEQADAELADLVDNETGAKGIIGDKTEVASGSFVYTKVPMSESLIESAINQGRDATGEPILKTHGGPLTEQQFLTRAAQRVARNTSNKELSRALGQDVYDSAAVEAFKQSAASDPKTFLSNFYAIKKQPVTKVNAPIVAASPEDTTITLTAGDVSTTSDKAVAKSIVRTIPNQGLTGERARAEVPLVQIARAPDGSIRRAKEQKRVSVNFPSLVSRGLTLLARTNAARQQGTDTLPNIARAFREGLASLFADHGLIIKNISKLPDETVVFFHKRKELNEKGKWVNKTTTLGEVRQHIKDTEKARRELPEYHAQVESKVRRETNQAVEDALTELFETNQTGTGDFEGGFTLEDIGRSGIATFIERTLLKGRVARKGKPFPQKYARQKEALGADTGGRVRKKAKAKKTTAKKAVGGAPAILTGSNELHGGTHEAAAAWAKQLGLGKIRLFTHEEAVAIFVKHGRESELIKTVMGLELPHVYSGFASKEGIYVNPLLSPAMQLETLAHEVGHAVFNKYARKALDAPELNAAMYKSFNKWREGIISKSDARISDVAVSKMAMNTALAMLSFKPNVPLASLDKKQLQYLLDFEEWFADNTAKFLTDEKVIPKNAVERFFKSLSAALRKLLKNFKKEPDKAVKDFLQAVQAGAKSTIHGQAAENAKKALNIKGIKMSTTSRGFVEEEGMGAYIAASDINSDQARAVIANWVYDALTQQEKRALLDAFKVQHVRAKIEAISGSMAVNPMLSIATGLQLWHMGKIKLGPKSTSAANKLAAWLKKLLGILSTEEKATAIMQAIQKAYIGTQVRDRSFHLKDVHRDDLIARAANTIADNTDKVMGHVAAYMYTADTRMQNNVSLQAIAQLFHARVGQEGATPQTYFEARTANIGKYTSILERAIGRLDTDSRDKVLKDAQTGYTGKGLDAEELRASISMQKLLEDMFTYAEKSGVSVTQLIKDEGGNYITRAKTIKHREKYFPVVYDVQYMMEHHDEFVAMLSKPKYAKRVSGDESVDKIYINIIQNAGYGDTQLSDDTEHTVGLTPAMTAVHQRQLSWIDQKDLQPFLSKGLEYTMVSYIANVVKRAEYTSRFGSNSEHLKTLLAAAARAGATDKELAMVNNYIDAMLGTLGRETNKKVYSLFRRTPTPGQVISPALQKAMSSVIVFRNFAVLGLAAFTSMADVVGITVRSGDLDSTWEAYKTGLGEIRTGIQNLGKQDVDKARSAASELARGLGVIDTHMTNEALEFEYGGTYMSSGLKRANETFFKWIGLTQLTQMTRVMALASAKNFVVKHGRFKKGYDKHSKRFMSELGIEQGDVKMHNGDLRVLSKMERADLLNANTDEARAELARDDRIRAGLNRWVDGAILRPNAAQRPIWASDPHYMLFFHLKSFMYSFHDRILRRAWSEMYVHGRIAPAAALMLYVPAMLAIDAARDWLKYGGGSPRKANWGFMDYTGNAIARAGLPGVGLSTILDAQSDRSYGGIGFETQAGAAMFPVQLASGMLTGNTYKIEKSLPAQNIWRGWVQ